MISRNALILVLAALAWQCFGATPIATISSSQPVVVSGITVPTNRVLSWPVAVNDEIVTQTAPALLRFTDGTVVTLQHDSRMRLVDGPSGVEVKMLSGSASYAVKAKSSVSFGPSVPSVRVPAMTAAGSPVPPASQNEDTAKALVYRTPSEAPSSGVVFAPSMISTASFSTGVGRQAAPAPQSVIILPSGLAVFVTPVMTQGVTTGYTIVGVGAVGSNGTIIQTAGVSTLTGYTITLPAGTSTTSQITLIPAGSTTPLTSTQAGTLIQSTTTSVNQSLPSGQQMSSNPGVTIQPFSASAP